MEEKENQAGMQQDNFIKKAKKLVRAVTTFVMISSGSVSDAASGDTKKDKEVKDLSLSEEFVVPSNDLTSSDIVSADADKVNSVLMHIPKYKENDQPIKQYAYGGTDKNPCTYKVSALEFNMLAYAIEAEASALPLEHKIAVGEVIMRRVMSSQYRVDDSSNNVSKAVPDYRSNGKHTIMDVLAAPGQYPTTWEKIAETFKKTGRIKLNLTHESIEAAKWALSGVTNFSQGTYFQHHNAGIPVVKMNGFVFSQSKYSVNFRLQSFIDAKGYDRNAYAKLWEKKKQIFAADKTQIKTLEKSSEK